MRQITDLRPNSTGQRDLKSEPGTSRGNASVLPPGPSRDRGDLYAIPWSFATAVSTDCSVVADLGDSQQVGLPRTHQNRLGLGGLLLRRCRRTRSSMAMPVASRARVDGSGTRAPVNITSLRPKSEFP
jgi:hypothetical protein